MSDIISNFECDKETADKTRTYWQVMGCSRKQHNITRRNGKAVSCGHKHRHESACAPCLANMLRNRSGNCQYYRAVKLVEFIFLRRTPGNDKPKNFPVDSISGY